MKKTFIFLALLFLTLIGSSQALYQISNNEKQQNSSLIIEGEVLDKVSFWNAEHSMIYTANRIKVYKIFKGNVTSDNIEIVTLGGNVGNDEVSVSELLELNEKEIGIFFCYANTLGLHSPVTNNILYDVYASAQGFIKYNLKTNRASDLFNDFYSISDDVYQMLNTLTGRGLIVKNRLQIPIFYRTNAVINSLTPRIVNAGATSDPANNLLSIRGTGFGTGSGAATIKFQDANYSQASGITYDVAYNSNLVVQWTDTLIQVRVPSRAGTGYLSVVDAGGGNASSPYTLNVFYSILSFSSSNITKQSNLSNGNTLGGYTMQYCNNMTTDASATFNRALKTWIDISGLNVTIGSQTSTASATGDGQCVVMMDNVANGGPLPSGVLAVCYSFNSACSPATLVDYRKTEFDVVIRSSYSTGTISFELGPCPPSSSDIDLETVLLHELGHGLNLGHIIAGGQGANQNPPKLMNYAVSNAVKRTSPDGSAYQGSLYTCATNSSLLFGSCTNTTGMLQLPRNIDAKDECPLNFPTAPTANGTTVAFDLEHCTSNDKRDPQYTGVLCTSSGTAVTNNLYYVIRTDNSGNLTIDVNNFTVYPSTATSCTGSNAVAGRISFYKVDSCPIGQLFPTPIACRTFTGNGQISSITGLLANTTYLLYADGRSNSKASFDLTFNGTALPIKLERFSGETRATYNELKWMISAFVDVDRIELQKSSNGIEFSVLSTYDRSFAINSEYLYNDNNPFAGKNFYRLAIYNKDRSVQYSNVVLLKRNDKVRVNVFPNPVVSHINVSISASENVGDVQLKLYNSVGQLVKMQTIKVVIGTINLSLETNKLSAGNYKLIISDKDNVVLKSLNLQKQ